MWECGGVGDNGTGGITSLICPIPYPRQHCHPTNRLMTDPLTLLTTDVGISRGVFLESNFQGKFSQYYQWASEQHR